MLYTLTIVPIIFAIIGLNLSFIAFTGNTENHRKINKVFFLLLAIQAIPPILGLRTLSDKNWIYLPYFLFLFLIFKNKSSFLFSKNFILFILILNVFFVCLEIMAAYLMHFMSDFESIYYEISHFAASNAAINANTTNLIRSIGNGYLLFVRPSGLFSNPHLSSFAMFCLYAWLDINNIDRNLRIILAFLIIATGSLQTIGCLGAYESLNNLQNPKRLFFVLLFVLLPMGVLTYFIYGNMEHVKYNNMFRIINDSFSVLRSTPVQALIFGGDLEKMEHLASTGIAHPEMLAESGFLRYTVTFGLSSLLLSALIIKQGWHDTKNGKKTGVQGLYFLIASLVTYSHYLMPLTFLGALFTIFVVRSDEHPARMNNFRKNKVKQEYND